MGIEGFIKRNCKQTTVYWASPTPDGYGGYSYADPVELACRWEDKEQVLDDFTKDGIKLISRAVVFVTQDVVVEGLMYLGTLEDLDSAGEENPSTLNDVFQIKRFEKSPMVGSTTEFLRKVFLTPWLT